MKIKEKRRSNLANIKRFSVTISEDTYLKLLEYSKDKISLSATLEDIINHYFESKGI